jgi:transglutaminase-like putative cysteine protease
MIALAKALKWILIQITSRFGARKPLMFLLLLGIVGSVAVGLAIHLRDFDIRLALPIAGAGAVLGLVLAIKAERAWSGVLLTMVVGLLLILIATGRLTDELLAVFPAAYDLARDGVSSTWQLLWGLAERAAVLPNLAESWETFVSAVTALTDGSGVVLGRVLGWASSLLRGEKASDPIAAAFFWALAVWAVVTWALWFVMRCNRVLLGVAPAGTLLVTTLFFVVGEPWGVSAVLGGVLLMMSLVAYDTRVRRIEAGARDMAYGIATDAAVVSVVLSVTLVSAAVVAPSVSIQDVFDFIWSLRARQASEGGSEGGGDSARNPWRPLTTFDEMRIGGLPRHHLVTTPPEELSKLVVMVISTGELAPIPEFVMEDVEVPSHYWRSVTYDAYAPLGWHTSGTWTAAYAAGDVAGPPALETERMLRQNVDFVSNLGGILHVDGTLVAVDQDYSVAWRGEGDAFGGTIDANAYVADSLVVEPTAEQLQAAGTDYPDWVMDRYLELPEAVTARTRALAQDLTATEPTPYDRAEAIETYLRTTYTYTLDVDLPPQSQDLVDYFLFDLRRGYCDYYASSMVVLARASGLPARMAIGYATGSYDPMEAHYVVTEADAHAWPEIYFPGYGWVRFEPTAGLPAIDRTEEEPLEWPAPRDDLLGQDEEAAVPVWERLGDRWWMLLGGGLGLPAVAFVLWLVVDSWWLRRMEPAAAVTRVYERVQRAGRRLGTPAHAGATPYEFRAAFIDLLKDLGKGRRWQETQALAGEEIELLTDTYVRVSYSASKPHRIDQIMAVTAWQSLCWPLWMARLRRGRRRRRGNRR